MEKKILIIGMLFISIFSFSQIYNGNLVFNSQSSVDNFLISCPSCTEISGSVTLDPSSNGSVISNLNGLQNITKINGSFRITQHNSLVRNLNGLNNLTYIGGDIYINDTWLNDISGFQNLSYVGGTVEVVSNSISNFSGLNNITHIGGSLLLSNDSGYCGFSGLMLQVTNIPGDLNYNLICNNNTDLSSLSSIASVGGDFILTVDNLTSLQGLNGLTAVGGFFQLKSCNLVTSLNGLDSLINLGGLKLNNNLNLNNVSNLNQITNLDQGLYIGSNQSLNNLNGLHNLNSITGDFYIDSNPNLVSLNELSDVVMDNVANLHIKYNQNLSLCEELNICNFLFNGGTYDIGINAQGCNDFNQLIESCNLKWKNLIKGNVKIDFENDGCGASDRPMENVMVKATGSGNVIYSTFTNSNGEYRMFVPQGSYVVQGASNLSNYSLAPLSSNAVFLGVGSEQLVDFCATSTQTVNDVNITFFQLNQPRPGFDVYYKIKYSNTGTTIMNGSVDFTFDSTKMSYISSNIPIQAQNGNLLSWNYSNLYPYQTKEIIVKFNVFTPPTVNGGDYIYLTATVNPISGDLTPANNTFSFNNLVVNSYDPNDKTVLQGHTVLLQNIGDYLNYVVRFQNTGSASAINIRIEDILESKLDPSTFQLLDLSHPGYVQIKNNEVNFIFDDINLPDSTSDEPNSHGYVSFRIKPINAVFGNILQNTASIFFDFNSPIITNTTSTFINADTDSDTVLDTEDNCITISNINQEDSDNDGVGDVCDDGIEVNPPYSIGFDTTTLDILWKKSTQGTSYYSDVTISNLNDVDYNGNTIKLFSRYSSYKTMLISPRLNNLSSASTISFWMQRDGYSSTSAIEIGFMTDPSNPSTFTRLKYENPSTTMRLYTLDLSDYNPYLGKNLAILVKSKTIYVDDFIYTNTVLSTEDNELNKYKIYPNPVTDLLGIENLEFFDLIKIYDINGRLMKIINFSENEKKINVSDFSQGLYFLEIQIDNIKHVEKFLKK